MQQLEYLLRRIRKTVDYLDGDIPFLEFIFGRKLFIRELTIATISTCQCLQTTVEPVLINKLLIENFLFSRTNILCGRINTRKVSRIYKSDKRLNVNINSLLYISVNRICPPIFV